jgi:anti-anti-sigma factor
MSAPALFSVATEKLDDRWLLRPTGELDVAAIPEMEQALGQAADGPANLEIDLSGVSFLDSSGLRLLLGARQRCQGAGGALTVTHPTDDTRRLLDLTGLTPLLLG